MLDLDIDALLNDPNQEAENRQIIIEQFKHLNQSEQKLHQNQRFTPEQKRSIKDALGILNDKDLPPSQDDIEFITNTYTQLHNQVIHHTINSYKAPLEQIANQDQALSVEEKDALRDALIMIHQDMQHTESDMNFIVDTYEQLKEYLPNSKNADDQEPPRPY